MASSLSLWAQFFFYFFLKLYFGFLFVWRQGLTVVLASLQLTLFVDQATLGFTEILLLLPLGFWD